MFGYLEKKFDRLVKIWNWLPMELWNFLALEIFKTMLDKYILPQWWDLDKMIS